MTDQVILRAENIDKRFTGTHALKGVSLTLRRGEIHALVGENGAGKSTLMNVISGVVTADSGAIYLSGKQVRFHSPNDARMAGIGFVHQELAIFQDLSVGDNVFVGHLPSRSGMVETESLNRKTRSILDGFGDGGRSIDPSAIVGSLSVAQQQMVEIAKALSSECKVLIFDEPTSSLNESEADSLFEVIRGLAAQGIGIIYISHKMAEIFSLCDTITIMRDGRVQETVPVSETTTEYVVTAMVSKEIGHLYPDKCLAAGDEVLRVEGLTRAPHFSNISFSTRRGEILGLCGLVGAGRTEIARAVCGIDRPQAGSVYLQGEKLRIGSYRDAQRAGICYLSEDRRLDGLFLEMSLTENIIAPQIRYFAPSGIVSRKRAVKVTEEYRKALNIKYSSPFQIMGSLSGGNQQKLMIAKILAMKPKVIFLDEPTRGIDVGAKAEIHQLLRDLSDQGISIVVISSEMPETVGVCDRVVVINVGDKVCELSENHLTQENIVSAISRFSNKPKGV
jgi:ribose transport system ATP-binding protein